MNGIAFHSRMEVLVRDVEGREALSALWGTVSCQSFEQQTKDITVQVHQSSFHGALQQPAHSVSTLEIADQCTESCFSWFGMSGEGTGGGK